LRVRIVGIGVEEERKYEPKLATHLHLFLEILSTLALSILDNRMELTSRVVLP
jgi:hypothetical protein